jgi:hypothetical protein
MKGRERESRKWGGVSETLPLRSERVFLLFLRQCPPAILGEVYLRVGEALGSEKENVLGFVFCYEQRKEVESRFYCV